MATTLETTGRRIYFVDSPYAVRDAIKAIGAKWDADKRQWWVSTAKRADAEKLVAQLNDPTAPKVKEDPNNIRLTGKGRYKGREYYAGAVVNGRVRLLTLPDDEGDYLDFWVDCAEVEETKTYAPRQVWDGRRGSNNTVTRYTTLGSIARFVREQKASEAAGLPQCAACGKRGRLTHDLEDGLMKCYGCCDMPEN